MTGVASDPRAGLVEQLGGLLVGAAVLAVLAPAMMTAIALGWLIDRRGWRRWPALVAGTLAAVLVAWAGAGTALGHVAAVVAARARPRTLGLRDVAACVALQVAVGVAIAAGLPVLLHHGDDAATRRHRQRCHARRSTVQARRLVARARWPTPPDRTVLGVHLDGAVPGCTIRHRTHRLLAVPVDEWGRQALIVGETGSGKTVTALTVASEAMRLGWDTYWIDGKADPHVAARFLGLARDHGRTPADASRDPVDGWRGEPESIVNRLLATQHFTEPYYAGIARNVLKWTVARPGPPRTFAELVARMDQRALRRGWRDDPDEADKIRAMAPADFLGARYRYEGVAWAVGATLDGHWSYEDVRAAYVPVGRPEHRDQAEEVGAFLLEDLLHWAMARKPARRSALVVVDEFSKLAARPDAAVELVERVRSFGVGVVLIGQTWASLGRSDAIRERLAGTVGTVVVHQLKQPDRLVELAGRTWTMDRTEQLLGQVPTGRGTQRAGSQPVVDPDEVRGLHAGEAFLIRGGAAVKVQVRPVGPASRGRPGP